MTTGRKVALAAAAVLGALVIAAGVAYLVLRPPADRRELAAIALEWNHAGADAGSEVQGRLAERCLELSRRFPDSVGGVSALLLAATRAGGTAAGQRAARQFAAHIETADLGLLAAAIWRAGGQLRAVPAFAEPLLARVRGSLDHPLAGRLLAACCLMADPPDQGEPSATYREAADTLAARCAASPDIHQFCEILASRAGSAPWVLSCERHLRAILAANGDRAVRCAARFALASVVLAAGEHRQAEARDLFEQFCAEFDGTHSYSYQGIEQFYRQQAVAQLEELRFRAIGNPVPPLAGVDLDGQPIALADYRGRVVLLSFWGSWCFPCRKLVPHERALAAAYEGRPFSLVGVNCDDDIDKARAAAVQTGMTWRSFQNRAAGERAITEEWKILGYPTLYLVDHHGTIRKRWVGAPPPAELGRAVQALVAAAEQRLPADAVAAAAAAIAAAAPARGTPEESAPPAPSRGDAVPVPISVADASTSPGTGFVEGIYRGDDGTEVRFAVFVPPTYDGTRAVPAILFLHGAGARGADGRAPLRHGLAPAIAQRGQDFPFLVVFPQAAEGEDWLAGTAGGRRALAILDQVQSQYRVDADRVALTGVSMGGAGTWSLAAADPQRWSAIVPICHGGDVATAPRLVGLPCWCFHGASDSVIPPQQSRAMVQAIADAGGRPLYHEFPGVGHNDCAARAYAMPELFEWLLLQNRARR